MKTIYGAISGLVVGFLGATLLAPKSGKETRKNIDNFANKSWFKTQMTYHKLAVKLGIGSSRKKIADLTKTRMDETKANNNGANVDPSTRENNRRSLEQVHSNSQATQAVNSSNAKDSMKKTPSQSYKK